MAEQPENKIQTSDQPLGVPPSEFHPQRPPSPFKKSGNVKAAILVGILIIIVDLFIYFFLLKPDDEQLLKAIEPLKPPTSTPAPSIERPTDLQPSSAPTVQLSTVTNLAKEDLAKRLKIDVSEIQVTSEETVTWNDGSMGCPQPDMMYTQALIEGSKVVLSAETKNFDYHAGTDGKPFLCENPAP